MSIQFDGTIFELQPDETVLEGIERQGLRVPFFCRSGVCQACVLRAKRGELPPLAQKGLRESQRRQGFFLPCVCRAAGDLEIERATGSEPFVARVERVEQLSAGVLQVLLAAPRDFAYEAGQFIQLERPGDGLMRPYSIASLPGSEHIELHVALLSGGKMSGWLRAAAGAVVNVRGPFGECFYLPGELERPLLLAGTGTGLAPLLGVLRAAIAAGHRAPIRLYHGSPGLEGLYFWAQLRALLAEAPALSITASVLAEGGDRDDGPRCRLRSTPLAELILREAGPLANERIYLCGHPDLVRTLQKKLYLAGAALDRIHSDPFVAPGPGS